MNINFMLKKYEAKSNQYRQWNTINYITNHLAVVNEDHRYLRTLIFDQNTREIDEKMGKRKEIHFLSFFGRMHYVKASKIKQFP